MSYLKYILLAAVFISCQSGNWYKKEFSAEEQIKLSDQLLNGSGYYYQGSVPEQFILEEALRFDSANGAVWREMGVAWLKRGLAKEMYPYYQRAVEIDAEKWIGMRGYNYLYFYRDYGRALADFNSTDSLTRDFVDHPQGQSVDYMRGICYYGLTDYHKALAYLNKYIESVIKKEGEQWVDCYAVLYRALTFEKLGDLNRALDEFDRVIGIYPNISDPFFHKARIMTGMGDHEAAITNLQKAREFFENGYFHQRPYVEVLDQIYLMDIETLEAEINDRMQNRLTL